MNRKEIVQEEILQLKGKIQMFIKLINYFVVFCSCSCVRLFAVNLFLIQC